MALFLIEMYICLSKYAAVCLFRRLAGRPDKGNCLDCGELRGNMQTELYSRLVQ